MNWTVDNNGAYDYAADYTRLHLQAVVEYFDKSPSFWRATDADRREDGMRSQWNIAAGAQNFFEF